MIRTFFFLALTLFAGTVAEGQDFLWKQVPGQASHIAIGPEGTVWILDTAHSANHVARLDDTIWVDQTPQGLRAVRLTVDFRERVWIVTERNQPYRYDEGRYFRVTGTLTDISASPNGTVVGIGTDAKAGGYGVWIFNGVGWYQTGGIAGVRIAVDPKGLFWVLDTGHNIFRYSTGVFDLMPGQAEAVSIGAEGSVWIIQPEGTLARWEADHWVAVAFHGRALDIAVGPDGLPWVADTDGKIWRMTAQDSGQ